MTVANLQFPALYRQMTHLTYMLLPEPGTQSLLGKIHEFKNGGCNSAYTDLQST